MTLTITRMTGIATIQDTGRPGYRADGVPVSGAMDVDSLALANALVGNSPDAAAIEWALAGGSLRFDTDAAVAVTGADVELTRNGAAVPPNVAMDFRPGDELTVGRFVRGTCVYIGVRGGIAVPEVLGSRSTYLAAGFGGLEGRGLRAGEVLPLGMPLEMSGKAIGVPRPITAEESTRPIRAIEGPNTAAFTREFRNAFWTSEFTVSPSSNRAGCRLDRDAHPDPKRRSLPSEPACIGAIQVASGAGAIVLLADGPTVGGYPKIGVVTSVDIPMLAQRAPGESVTFELITIEEAQRLLRGKRSLAQPGAGA